MYRILHNFCGESGNMFCLPLRVCTNMCEVYMPILYIKGSVHKKFDVYLTKTKRRRKQKQRKKKSFPSKTCRSVDVNKLPSH